MVRRSSYPANRDSVEKVEVAGRVQMQPVLPVPMMPKGIRVGSQHGQKSARPQQSMANSGGFQRVIEMLNDMAHNNGVERFSRKQAILQIDFIDGQSSAASYGGRLGIRLDTRYLPPQLLEMGKILAGAAADF